MNHSSACHAHRNLKMIAKKTVTNAFHVRLPMAFHVRLPMSLQHFNSMDRSALFAKKEFFKTPLTESAYSEAPVLLASIST
jgi:hypothetical protein